MVGQVFMKINVGYLKRQGNAFSSSTHEHEMNYFDTAGIGMTMLLSNVTTSHPTPTIFTALQQKQHKPVQLIQAI